MTATRASSGRMMLSAAMLLIAAAAFAQDVPPEPRLPAGPAPVNAHADASADAPAALPATRPAGEMQQWLADLADTDPAVREQAKVNLMGLRRDELGALRALVEASRPLAPSQSAVLQDIVLHAYLAGEPYERNPRVGFVGVMLEDVSQPGGVFVGEDDPAATAPPEGPSGVLISACVPGFCGFRYLRPGDLVMGVLADELTPTPMRDELQERVRATPPGGTLTLQVLREGKVIRLAFRIDHLPRAAEAGMLATEAFRNERRDKGQRYWDSAFAPLLEPAPARDLSRGPAEGAGESRAALHGQR